MGREIRKKKKKKDSLEYYRIVYYVLGEGEADGDNYCS